MNPTADKFKKILIGVSLVALAVFGCQSPTQESPATDPFTGALTSVNGTVTAQAGTALALTQPTILMTDTPLLSTEATPSLTVEESVTIPAPEEPSPTLTITPIPTITVTPSPVNPLIRVSVDTDCRAGPGDIYEGISVAQVGIRYRLIGRDIPSNSWVILLPDGRQCWIGGQSITLEGNPAAVPAFLPPVGSISGIIFDTNSPGQGAGARNVNVTIQPANRSTKTGEDGTYSFNNVPIGNITIQAGGRNTTRIESLSVRLYAGQAITDAIFRLGVIIPNEGDHNCPTFQICGIAATPPDTNQRP
jgi:hypothetical protein